MKTTRRFIWSALLACALMSIVPVWANPLLTPGAWTDITPAGSNPSTAHPFWYIALAPSNTDIIYSCQQMGGGGNMWKTTNGGETWIGLNSGSIPANYGALTTTYIDNPQVPPSAVDPSDPNHLFCNQAGWSGDGKTGGLWESTNGGQSWFRPQGWLDYTASPNSNSDVGRFETDKGDYKHMLLSFRYVGGTDGYLETMDGFKTYIFHAKPAFDWGGGTHGFHFLHNDGDQTWTGRSHTWVITSEAQGFHKTTDGGQTWTEDMTPTGRHGGTENVYYGYDGAVYCGGVPTCWRSSDNGVTWNAITQGNGNWGSICGDGENLYTSQSASGPVQSAPENDFANWKVMVSQPGSYGVALFTHDPAQNLVYGAANAGGVWVFKPVDSTALHIMVSPLSVAIAGQPYADTLIALRGVTPLSWSVISGVLPGGISLSSTGIISGTTNAPNGAYTFTVQVKDASNNSSPAAISLTVDRLRDPDNPSNTLAGLAYDYYHGAWSTLPSFPSLTPVKAGICSTFVLTMRDQDTNYGLRFTGYVTIPSDGSYTFFTSSDDGSRLFIGTDTVVNNDGSHGATEKSGTILLKAGKHAITVDYFQGAGGASLSVSWQFADGAKSIVPDSVLSHGGATKGKPSALRNSAGVEHRISFTSQGVKVDAAPGESWTLDLFGLNGGKIGSCKGIGSGIATAENQKANHGFVIARLTIQGSNVLEKTVSR